MSRTQISNRFPYNRRESQANWVTFFATHCDSLRLYGNQAKGRARDLVFGLFSLQRETCLYKLGRNKQIFSKRGVFRRSMGSRFKKFSGTPISAPPVLNW